MSAVSSAASAEVNTGVNSGVNGKSFVSEAGGLGRDNGQLGVVVSDNTKDNTRPASSRRHWSGRVRGLRGLACRQAYTAGDRRWRISAGVAQALDRRLHR